MTQIIRVFDNFGNAEAAVRELRSNNFPDAIVSSPDTTGAGLNGGARARSPQALVTVQAPFGTAARAITILDDHGGNSDPAIVAASGSASSQAGSACTVSSVLGIPELTSPGPFFSAFPQLIESPTPLSSMFGLPVLMDEHHD